jgi:hypothetical protein
MLMKGPTREIYPVGRQKVSVAVPAGRSFAEARLLVAGETAEATVEAGRVVVTVPTIDLVEAVHITWA